MTSWLRFLLFPLVVYWILGFIASLITGPDGFWSYVLMLVTSFIFGAMLFSFAPDNSAKIAYSFATIYVILMVYFGIDTHGQTINVFGEEVEMQYNILGDIVSFIGMYLGILGAHQSHKDEQRELAQN